jgi:hypothetical protein
LPNNDGIRPNTSQYHPKDKANAIADSLENIFIPHDLSDEKYERRVEDRVQALLEAEDNDPSEKIRPCDLLIIISSLKPRRACGIDDVPNECTRHLPRRPLVHLTHLINHCIRLSYFPTPWTEAKVIA